MDAVTALLGFVAWTLALVLVVLFYRVFLVFTFKKPANAWPRGGASDDPPLMLRVQHAHLNCLESLPVFATLVLAGAALGKLPLLDPVAQYVLYLRLAQSGTHLIGTTAALVFVRANFFTLQLALFGYMLWRLLA